MVLHHEEFVIKTHLFNLFAETVAVDKEVLSVLGQVRCVLMLVVVHRLKVQTIYHELLKLLFEAHLHNWFLAFDQSSLQQFLL